VSDVTDEDVPEVWVDAPDVVLPAMPSSTLTVGRVYSDADLAQRDKRVRAETLREAADEIHTERRWQVEKARTGVQSIHNYCDGRLAVVEQILRARADAEEGK